MKSLPNIENFHRFCVVLKETITTIDFPIVSINLYPLTSTGSTPLLIAMCACKPPPSSCPGVLNGGHRLFPGLKGGPQFWTATPGHANAVTTRGSPAWIGRCRTGARPPAPRRVVELKSRQRSANPVQRSRLATPGWRAGSTQEDHVAKMRPVPTAYRIPGNGRPLLMPSL